MHKGVEKMLHRQLTGFIIFLFSIGLSTSLADAQKMYFTVKSRDTSPVTALKIQRANLDGSGIEDIQTNTLNPEGIALDIGAGHIYWTDWGIDMVRYGAMDGSALYNLEWSIIDKPKGIALDVSGNRMYWTDRGGDGGGARVMRCWLGWVYNVEVILDLGSIGEDASDIALDLVSNKMYCIDMWNDKIWRANLDGSGFEDLITTGVNPLKIALDVNAGKMYWTDYPNKIQRANLDGTGVETLIETEWAWYYGIALDVGAGKMYWTDEENGEILRANLDGSSIDTLITVESPLGIALDPNAGKMYWTDVVALKIQRANLDGSGVETIHTYVLYPYRIALDIESGHIYWTEPGVDLIRYGAMESSALYNLEWSIIDKPEGIALDVSGNRMYWTDNGGGDRVMRCWLGWVYNVEVIFNFMHAGEGVSDMTLDLASDKMYCIDTWNDKIWRANLDGSGLEDLITTGLNMPHKIALDVGAGKMYWTDYPNKIQRANLDGSGVETLIETEWDGYYGIALDLGAGKMYWTDYENGEIQRANLDGSGVEILITGLDNPRTIALEVADGDGDGIIAEVDADPVYFSNDFNDFGLGGATSQLPETSLTVVIRY
jgi:low density lipoprotein receptor-related protein 5/6